MISLNATIWLWSGEQGTWHFLTIPEEEAVEIRAHRLGTERRGFGSVRVAATINASTVSRQAVSWRTSIFPQKSGGYILPIKADVRRRAGVGAGDLVTVAVELL